MKSLSKPPTLDRQARLLFVFMVIIGYIVTFVLISGQDGRKLTHEKLF